MTVRKKWVNILCIGNKVAVLWFRFKMCKLQFWQKEDCSSEMISFLTKRLFISALAKDCLFGYEQSFVKDSLYLFRYEQPVSTQAHYSSWYEAKWKQVIKKLASWKLQTYGQEAGHQSFISSKVKAVVSPVGRLGGVIYLANFHTWQERKKDHTFRCMYRKNW